ncbi:MAG: hypothetical protein QM564_01195 [Bergeyella sp.]
MIGRFENFIRNSGLEATWSVYNFVFSLINGLLLGFLINLFEDSNFIDIRKFTDSYLNFSIGIFFLVFIIVSIKKLGFSKIFKSVFRLLFFMIFVNGLAQWSGGTVIPNKYNNWDDFILIENLSEEKERKITFIEKLLKKIWRS